MSQPSVCSIARPSRGKLRAVTARRAALVGLRFFVAFAMPPLAFAQEAHPAAPRSTEESAFLKENDAAMTKMMDGMAAKPSGVKLARSASSPGTSSLSRRRASDSAASEPISSTTDARRSTIRASRWRSS